MKTLLSFFALFLFSLSILAQPYASKIDTPKNPDNDPELAFGIQILSGVEIPEVKDVKVAPYPGAKIFQTTIAQSGMLPTVRLLSTDEVSKVTEYYKKELADWNYKDFYGIHTFFKGDETKAMMMQGPVVQIESADKFNNLMPSAKSAITIGYDSAE